MKIIRILLYPISLLYSIIIAIRNKMYDYGILSSHDFSIPTISVGNLSVGGTGKTPHIEYLIRLLKTNFSIATLSRGYGRKTSGFLVAKKNHTSFDIGDEPKQFRKKFQDIAVAVDGNRVRGIKKLMELFPHLNIILLDDALQHRSVKPGMSILLSDYTNLYYNDTILPFGTLREGISGASRADIIIITKTPPVFSPLEKRRITKDIAPQPYQKIFFSYIKYGNFIPMFSEKTELALNKEYYFERKFTIVLLAGIANTWHLEEYLTGKASEVVPVKFHDHHEFSIVDVLKVQEVFNKVKSENKIILTTEKDIMRLDKPGLMDILTTLPIYYIPIEIAFHDKDGEEFNTTVFDFIRSKFEIKNKS